MRYKQVIDVQFVLKVLEVWSFRVGISLKKTKTLDV